MADRVVRTVFWLGVTVLLSWSAGAWAEVDSDALNGATVKIRVHHRDGEEVGAGIVLCEAEGRLQILTAKHVLFGEGGVDEAGKPRRRFRGVSRVEVEFHKDRREAVADSPGGGVFKIRRARHKDVALLQISGTGAGAPLPPLPVGRSAEVKALHTVATTGHPVDLARNWFAATGTVNSAGEFIEYSARIGKGYSGGPVVDAQGRLVGMNVQVDRGLGGMMTARALPIDEVLSTIGAWMDLACVRRDAADAAEAAPAGHSVDLPAGTYVVDEARGFGPVTGGELVFERGGAEAFMSLLADTVSGDVVLWEAELELGDGTMTGTVVYAEGLQSTGDPVRFSVEREGEGYRLREQSGWSVRVRRGQEDTVGEELHVPAVAGSYRLSRYQNAFGGTVEPPLIQGSLEIRFFSGQQGSVQVDISSPDLALHQVVSGSYDGRIFSGQITQSSLFINQGTYWAAELSLAGDNLVMAFANGEVFHWVRR